MPFNKQTTIKSKELDIIHHLLTDYTGLIFPEKRLKDGLFSAAYKTEVKDLQLYISQLIQSRAYFLDQIPNLINHLTIGETSFFRNPETWSTIKYEILPPLIQQRRQNYNQQLKFYSVGCSTGEEPYSLAILLLELIPDIDHWNIEIQAVDINKRSLEKAKVGRYKEWSFRNNMPLTTKAKWFELQDNLDYQIKDQVKQYVRFNWLNLGDHTQRLFSWSKNIDLMLCRNVLMYFEKNIARHIIIDFHQSIRPTGWLVVSACETSNLLNPYFTLVNFKNQLFYQRAELSQTIENEDNFINFTSLVIPPELDNPSQSHDFKKAITYYKQNNLKDLETLGNSIKSEHSETLDIWRLLVFKHAKKQAWDEALNYCQKMISLQPQNPSTYFLNALILNEAHRIQEAETILKKILYLNPCHVMSHLTLAIIASSQQNFHKAHMACMQAKKYALTYPSEQLIPDSNGLSAHQLLNYISCFCNSDRQLYS